MNDYPAGTVALVTWDNASQHRRARGESDIKTARAMFTADGRWSLASAWNECIDASTVTDVRPLPVLDLTPAYGCWTQEGNPSIIVNALRETNLVAAHAIADQIEAQTKPPRIPEPGWGEKVIASTKDGKRRQFVHAYGFQGGSDGVWTDAAGFHAAWDDLIDPVLVRPGIEDHR